MNTEDDEQKFCCGDMTNRFCCSFAEKLREVPGFDPSKHYDSRSSSRHVFTNFQIRIYQFSNKYYVDSCFDAPKFLRFFYNWETLVKIYRFVFVNFVRFVKTCCELNNSVRYRLGHSGHWHFWHYLLGFTLSVLGIGFITYVFGSIIFEVSMYI